MQYTGIFLFLVCEPVRKMHAAENEQYEVPPERPYCYHYIMFFGTVVKLDNTVLFQNHMSIKSSIFNFLRVKTFCTYMHTL